jgi:uncharacterized protein YdeI (YjbR/CyaY-like superfamily)
MKKGDYEILAFESGKEFRSWLENNHITSNGIFIRLYKKGSGVKSVTYAEALDEALCFGWIDSLVNKFDEKSYIQKFTPRRSKSVWSKVNIGKVDQLIKDGRMTDAGLAEIERAKGDGRWEAAYDSPTNMRVPKDFLELVEKNKRAKEFFETLNKSNKFAIAFQLHNAKRPETRERRMQKFLEMLERGEKLY